MSTFQFFKTSGAICLCSMLHSFIVWWTFTHMIVLYELFLTGDIISVQGLISILIVTACSLFWGVSVYRVDGIGTKKNEDDGDIEQSAPMVFMASPLSGDYVKNTEYAKKAMKDCFDRGESPFAPHLLYPRVLDDRKLEEREAGIRSGLVFLSYCDKVVVYMDNGISSGMTNEINKAAEWNIPVEYRRLDDEA